MGITQPEEIKERKERILAITIGHYIKTITPVSSAYISKSMAFDISSATIRNILAELEEDGYLTHPHTSAGRVPTEKGYRYYVDHLMYEIELLEEEKRRIKEEYQRESSKLEKLLEKTSYVLSEITNYTSIISIDGESRIFCQGTNFIVSYPDYQDLRKIQSILRALDEKQKLMEIINRDLERKTYIYIGHEMACQEIDHCSLVVSRYETKHGSTGRLAILGPTRMDYQRVVSTIDYFVELMEEIF